MADQTGGSPWDEPLPEVEKPKNQVPTVVGNLDVQSNQQSSSQSQAKPQELKVPTDTSEKVGAKINVGNQQQAAVQNQPPQVKPSGQNPPVQPIQSVVQADQTVKSTGAEPNFWQSVYGGSSDSSSAESQTQNAPTSNVAQAASVKPIQQKMQPVNQVPQQHPIQPQPQAGQQNKAPNPVASAPKQRRSLFSNKINVAIAGFIGILVLFAGGIFLTEQGLISIGLEKIYGLARLESLWGGLPANAENAFLLSAGQMKNQSSFKTTGTLTATVNSGIKSKAISPIISNVEASIVSFKDQSMANKIKAVLTASDDEMNFDELEIEEVETLPADNSSATNSGSANLNSSTTIQNDDASTGQEISPGSSNNNSAGTTASQSIVKEFTADISANFTNEVSGTDINFTNVDKQNSKIQLIYSNKKLYFKTSNDIAYASGAKGGWLSAELNNVGSQGPSNDLWSSNYTSSGFSIIGKRLGSQSINGVRCFHYSGQVNIGDSLKAFGIDGSEISSVDLEYWIGVKDHLVRKTDIKIATNGQSTISQIELNLDYSGYGGSDNQYTVPATSSPYTSESALSVSPETAKGRDTQRKTDLSSIAQALESYHTANGKYPTVNGLAKISSDTGILYSALVPSYLSKLPIDPNDPKHYYGYESDGKTYKLSAVLEDPADTSGKKVGNNLIYYLSSL